LHFRPGIAFMEGVYSGRVSVNIQDCSVASR
jgi:hypothetical protein